MTFWLTGDEAADSLLDQDPFALLLGMLLDQQMKMEAAFSGPKKLADRMGGLDVHRIAEADPAQFEELAATPPAVHRYPRAMAGRIQAVARTVVDEYDGDAARLWTDGGPDAQTVLKRLTRLPGFGKQKAQIFVALLAKRRGVDLPCWQEVVGPYGEEGVLRSVADVTDAESLAAVREAKRAYKAALKAAGG